ncbi:hypothetical protein [Burkholderia cepacia]|uniref:hypothetical protein n=1 Tax=Burkholderia cepacia TaxID=292 RepID=UPI0011D2B501|nr:hypothetical protein [Burkholderia cepacia]
MTSINACASASTGIRCSTLRNREFRTKTDVDIDTNTDSDDRAACARTNKRRANARRSASIDRRPSVPIQPGKRTIDSTAARYLGIAVISITRSGRRL